MDHAQYIMALIAALPFVIWTAILYVLSAAPSVSGGSEERAPDADPAEAAASSLLRDVELPDVSLEYYYRRRMEYTPYISS